MVQRVLNNEKSPSQLELVRKATKTNSNLPVPQDVKEREQMAEIRTKILNGCRSTFSKDAHGGENQSLG